MRTCDEIYLSKLQGYRRVFKEDPGDSQGRRWDWDLWLCCVTFPNMLLTDWHERKLPYIRPTLRLMRDATEDS